MESAITIILGTVAIYLALFIHMAFSPKISNKILTVAAAFSVLCGLVFYGICFSTICQNKILAIAETCAAVCKLFIGEGSAEAIQDSPLLQYDAVKIVFSTLSFVGIFTTAGAAVSAIGASFLRKARLRMQLRKTMQVIFTLSSETLEFARELAASSKNLVVMVDENPDPALAQTASELGCNVFSDSNALDGNKRFLRSVGITKHRHKVFLYAIGDDHLINHNYAEAFLAALQERQIPAARTSLTIFGVEDDTHNALLASDGRYGYGNVLCVNKAQIAARLLLQKAPLYETVSFDETGKATEDFHALVIGSGTAGQAVMKQIVMNGQFYGSHFSMAVFDPDYDSVIGRMHYECRELFKHYDIQAYPYDARSTQMYAYLSENYRRLKYIVISSGCDDINREIARQICHFLSMKGAPLPVYLCSSRGLRKITATTCQMWNLFTASVLCSDEIDRMAMLLNHKYCGNDKTPRQNWADCDYFSRMSSRASADYAPAFLKMAGIREPKPGQWVSGVLLENMAISEHMRWCAFHYAMGFRPMTAAEFSQRSQIYLEEKAAKGMTRYRIGKDLQQRIHCCLVNWDELDALSARENAVTGGNVDYKAMDRDNVLMLPELISAAKE